MSEPIHERQTAGELINESKSFYVWKLLKSELLKDSKILSSPTFITTMDNKLSNWYLQFERNKNVYLIVHHNGEADIYARIRCTMFSNPDDFIIDSHLPRQKIPKIGKATGVIAGKFHLLNTDFTNDPYLYIGCEITFDSGNNDMHQLQLQTLPAYQSQRLQEFDEFEKLLNEPRFADVSFQVVGDDDREPLLAHRNILSARSPVFKAMFEHEMLENKRSRVDIEDVGYDVMKELLKYLYTAKLTGNLGLNMMAELLVAAEKYNVEGLKTRCEKILGDGMTAANVLRFLPLADTHNATELRARGIAFIVANSEEIVDSAEFKLFVQLQPQLICEIFQALVDNKRVKKH